MRFVNRCIEEIEGGLKEVDPDDSLAEKYLIRARHHFRLGNKLIEDSDSFLENNDVDPGSLNDIDTLSTKIDDETEMLFYDWAIIATYYGIYHSILALLISIGYTSKNHSCAIAALEHFFYRKNDKLENRKIFVIQKLRAVEKRMVDDAWTMKDRRERTAYGIALSTERFQAEESLEEGRWFLENVINLIDQIRKVPPTERVERYNV